MFVTNDKDIVGVFPFTSLNLCVMIHAYDEDVKKYQIYAEEPKKEGSVYVEF
jgi:hypothetical protein